MSAESKQPSAARSGSLFLPSSKSDLSSSDSSSADLSDTGSESAEAEPRLLDDHSSTPPS